MSTASMSPTIENLGQSVPLNRISAALRQLWANDEAVTKASLINFVIYSETADQLAHNSQLMEAVTRAHACRALLFGLDAQATAPQAWVTAHCQLSGGGKKSVCSEQLSFALPTAGPDLVRNLIFAHLESDLPLVFWWQGDFSSHWEPHLYRRIDRLVIDSASWSDAATQLKLLKRSWKDASSHFVVLDLTWIRLFPFRQALAGAYDEATIRTALDEVTEVQIDHAPGHEQAAKLLAAWIIYKTGWDEKKRRCIFKSVPGATISRCALIGPQTQVVLTQAAEARYVHTQMKTAAVTREQLTPALSHKLSDLVIERLARGGNNPLYFNLWTIAQRL
jgi:glucose-6-phosphate dehydrogenase assembly protein OpcA